MEPHSQPAGWVEAIGWVSLGLAFASTLIILYDIFVRGYRQHMKIMDVVYPITALYFGPLALWFYAKYGRVKSPKYMEAHGGNPQASEDLRWYHTAEAVSHCGAGCTVGDIAGEWLVLAAGLTAFGLSLPMDYLFDFVFAWSLGIVFQYFTIMPMRENLGRLQGVWTAIKADTLSIVAFQIGLFGGMALYQQLIWNPGLPKATAAYWMMMQLAMIIGFFTAWPINSWLIKKGIKEKM